MEPTAPHSGSVIVARSPLTYTPAERHPMMMGASLADLARVHDLNPRRQPVIASLNGKWVLQRDWAVTHPEMTDVVQLVAIPQGGGSTSIRAALLIAVTVAAAIAAPYAAPALAGLGFSVSTSTAIAQAAIVAAGTVLINALVPPEAARTYGTASPTYDIATQGNSARLGAPIPVIYGRALIFPDYAAPPFVLYASNRQTYHALFCIGQGAFDVEAIRIDDSPASSFRDLETQIVAPGETLTLFNPYVWTATEVQSQLLRGPNETGGDWLGWFPACPAGEEVSQIAIDIDFPQGLLYIDGDGDTQFMYVYYNIEARRIDDVGNPIGDGSAEWTEAAYRYASTFSPLRITDTYTMPQAGRWAVRIKRVTNGVDSNQYFDDLYWTALKGISSGPMTFPGVTMLAVKVRASDQINGATARRVNVIATRKLPTYSGGVWTDPVATRNPAWAFADLMRNSTYAAGLADIRIEPDALAELADVWDARGDTFDRVFDTPTTVWDAALSIARAGRAKPYQQSGLVRLYRDAPGALPSALFTPQNIVAGSFKLTCAMHVEGESADGVECDYVDGVTWRPTTIVIGVDGDDPEKPARENLSGVTQAAQAEREAAYMAAANRYRRAFISFRTELEGLIPSPGDLVLISHDIGRWAASGRVESWNEATKTVTVAEDVELVDGGTYFMTFRGPRGGASAMVSVVSQPGLRQITLANVPVYGDGSAFEMRPGDLYFDREPTHYTIGSDIFVAFPSATFQVPARLPARLGDDAIVSADDQINVDAPRPAIVVSAIPRGDTVEIVCVLDDDRVYVN